MARALLAPRSLVCLVACLLGLVGASLAVAPPARADTAPCAQTVPAADPAAPSLGHPCWTDVNASQGGTGYPFGSDGNPVDPNSSLCNRPGAPSGSQWKGDFDPQGSGVQNNPPCYLQVNSLAFRAWNRGLAATGVPANSGGAGTIGFGVWLYNGTNWFPDPTFPGSNVCPGSVVLWAGKLDYWLIGPQVSGGTATQETTVCRFDGVNLEWEPLSLPAATLASLPENSLGKPVGGITSGACYAWNNCWFFGNAGIEVHWDGQALSNASTGIGQSPWLGGDATAAVAGTDPSGSVFGLAVGKSTTTLGSGAQAAVPAAPDGSRPPQLFGSRGGAWTPVSSTSAGSTLPNGTTDLAEISADWDGDVWVAGGPNHTVTTSSPPQTAPAPLERLTEAGSPAPCSDYSANTFTRTFPNGYQWEALATFPDGSALAGARYENNAITWSDPSVASKPDIEPQLVHAVCGYPPGSANAPMSEFRRPDPLGSDQDPSTAYLIPADLNGYISAAAANASNDAWAATSDGTWNTSGGGGFNLDLLAPHLYRWTDGQTPDAPAGDDNEPRPSLFTVGPPVYVVGSPTVVVTPIVTTTTTAKGKAQKRKLLPAIYDVHEEKLQHVSGTTYILYFSFKVRRPVTVGLEGLRGRTVVASTGLKRFTRHTGQLALTLNRNRWPTRLSFVTPKKTKK